MMTKFEENRINKAYLNTNIFKQPIPVVWVQPKTENTNSVVFIYVCGLGGTNSFNVYMNHPIYDDNYFVMYDKMGHGENKNEPCQYKSKYLKELDAVVDYAKTQFPNKKIYLLGESWGCAINFLYYKKHANKIDGVINWNMPTKPVSPKPKTAYQNWQFAWREIFTFITNKNLLLPIEQSNHEFLTRNVLLRRLMAMMPSTRNSTRLTLAVWRFMRPSYKFLISNASNPSYNFLYIQSAQDNLATWKHINKVESVADKNHFKKFSTGFHILTQEPEESELLYKEIQNFINKK